MKEYHTLIADIRTEACELADKLKRLEVFMMSEDFCKISAEQKGLLEQQYDLMAKYKVTLVKRAHRINYEHLQNQGKEDAQEPERMEPHVFAAMEYEAHRQKKEEEPQEHAQPSDCVNCRWGERTIEGEHITCTCRNPDKTISRDKCFEARKY